jgi:hypothetical protein
MALLSSSISSLLLQSSSLSSSSPSFCQVCDLRFTRRSIVSGVAAAAGTVAWPGSIAAVASSSSVALAGRVMAANVGDRQAAILATRRGMQLFSKVVTFAGFHSSWTGEGGGGGLYKTSCVVGWLLL